MSVKNGQRVMGVIGALGGELGSLRAGSGGQRRVGGARLAERELDCGGRLVLCSSGVGGPAAAAGAAALMGHVQERGFELVGVLVVGLAGGIGEHIKVGDRVHCERALDRKTGGQARPCDRFSEAWQASVPGARGRFVTVEQPVLDPTRRQEVLRDFPGALAVDMETATIACLASQVQIPWAAMRVISDLCGFNAERSFRNVFPEKAGQAADTVPHWVSPFLTPKNPTTS